MNAGRTLLVATLLQDPAALDATWPAWLPRSLVSAARPLVANNDLVEVFRRGQDRADKPCTYCNRCLVNVVENPLGCYDETRFPSRDAMVAQIMSVFDPPPFSVDAAGVGV